MIARRSSDGVRKTAEKAHGTLKIKQREKRERPVNLSYLRRPWGTEGEGNNRADERSAKSQALKRECMPEPGDRGRYI